VYAALLDGAAPLLKPNFLFFGIANMGVQVFSRNAR